MSATTDDQLMDIAGLAERLGVGARFVRRLVTSGASRSQTGRHMRFEAAEVKGWIATAGSMHHKPFFGSAVVSSRVAVGRSADG